MEEVKPPVTTVTRKSFGEEEKEQPVTIVRIGIVVFTVAVSVPFMFFGVHAIPLLDAFFNGMKPIAGYLGSFVGLSLFVLVALSVWYAHDRFRVDIKRRIIEAGKFQVDPMSGNYDAYLDEKKQFLVPRPGVTVTPVPQTFAPQLHFINKGSVSKVEEKSNQPLLEQGNVQKPSVDELANKIERNSLQVNLGRSLTTGNDLIINIDGSHGKIYGTTQSGKTCLVVATLKQLEMTHDPERLQLVLLDPENKVGMFFKDSAHLAQLEIGRGHKAVMYAKSDEDVPLYLHYVAEELERRSKLETHELPHLLVYFEELLYTKKALKLQGGKTCAQFLLDLDTIATRGLKVGIHFWGCMQADYADEDLKDAKAQFKTRIGFYLPPSTAASAGFVRHDLVKKIYESNTPGEFVVEAPGVKDIGIAPEYDVKAKLKSLYQTRVLATRETKDLSLESGWQEGRNQLESPLQAIVADLDGEQWAIEQFDWKLDQLKALLHETQDEQYRQIWEVSPGSGREFKKARAERVAIVKHVQSLLSNKIA